MATILTTLGKYSTAQLLIPPVLLAGTVGGANYAYKKYRQWWVRKTNKHLDVHAHRKLVQHNSFVDMMRKRYQRPYYHHEERNRQQQQQQLADKVRRAEAQRRNAVETNAAREHDRINTIRARERAQADNYMNKLRERDQLRRAEAQRERSKWSPTNWFRGNSGGKPNRRKRGPEDDDSRPSSPVDFGSPDGPYNRPPHGHNHNNSIGNPSSRKHHSGGRRR